jgi:hypothetical protein
MNQVHAADALVGAWRLVSWENQAADGQVTYPMGANARGYLLHTADGRFSVTISRVGRPRSPPATCSVERPRRRPEPWRASWPTWPLQLPSRPRHPSCRAVVVPQLGRQRPGAVGRAGRGPADPECQPAAAGGQAAGAPPGLGAGLPVVSCRVTAVWLLRRDPHWPAIARAPAATVHHPGKTARESPCRRTTKRGKANLPPLVAPPGLEEVPRKAHGVTATVHHPFVESRLLPTAGMEHHHRDSLDGGSAATAASAAAKPSWLGGLLTRSRRRSTHRRRSASGPRRPPAGRSLARALGAEASGADAVLRTTPDRPDDQRMTGRPDASGLLVCQATFGHP